ncbi:Bor family protein [Marinomonas sp. 15G1-11]|uniref:Bor family protein n=1 Tax=Marinomonas phaeophyticola TaxID=3004091 RepID=A0ABT4JSU2_9GAMM|nr:Bor family protein [Marinomonas sp. 15G1-11]MCZ2721461.1 Bor family protein [Marinomonas sp. 15G1-11]
MKKQLLLITMTSSLLFGCATQTFNLENSNAPHTGADNQQSFFISGIGQEKQINAAEICHGADNVVKVQTEQTFVNGLLGIITFGIYTPRQARVFCKQ